MRFFFALFFLLLSQQSLATSNSSFHLRPQSCSESVEEPSIAREINLLLKGEDPEAFPAIQLALKEGNAAVLMALVHAHAARGLQRFGATSPLIQGLRASTTAEAVDSLFADWLLGRRNDLDRDLVHKFLVDLEIMGAKIFEALGH